MNLSKGCRANGALPWFPVLFARAQAVAAQPGLNARYIPVYTETGLDAALAHIAQSRGQAVVTFAEGFTMSFGSPIVAFSPKERIPAVSGWGEFARRTDEVIA